MKNSLLQRRLARLEAKSEAQAKAIENELIAKALRELSDTEVDRLEQLTAAGRADACWRGASTKSVDELVTL